MSDGKNSNRNRQNDRFIRVPLSYTSSTSSLSSNNNSFSRLNNDLNRYVLSEEVSPHVQYRRNISKSPVAVLEVSNMSPDFYLNLMDWKLSTLGLAIGNAVYLYDVHTKRIEPWPFPSSVSVAEENSITSFQFHKVHDSICAGLSDGKLCVVSSQSNASTVFEMESLAGHRIAVMDGRLDGLVACGNKMGVLFLAKPTTERRARVTINAHEMEICGLRWHPANENIIASGGNDNSVRVWDIRNMHEPVYRNDDFRGAVRALDWCPWNPGILCAGGGSSDRTLRTIKYQEDLIESIVDTGSQICSAFFYGAYHEIVTTHGFVANDIGIWKYPGLHCIDRISSFNNRILQSVLNADMNLLAAGCPGDRLIKIWSLESKVKDEFNEGKKLR